VFVGAVLVQLLGALEIQGRVWHLHDAAGADGHPAQAQGPGRMFDGNLHAFRNAQFQAQEFQHVAAGAVVKADEILPGVGHPGRIVGQAEQAVPPVGTQAATVGAAGAGKTQFQRLDQAIHIHARLLSPMPRCPPVS